jgi:hypothetical protein
MQLLVAPAKLFMASLSSKAAQSFLPEYLAVWKPVRTVGH